MKNRIRGFIRKKKVKQRIKTGKKIKIGKKMVEEAKTEFKTVGMNKNLPTAFRNEINQFLAYLESDNDRFDSAVIAASKDLKGLYACVRRRPPERHNNVLFKRKYPEDSKLSVYKKITNASTPEEAARLIVENKIPYRIAVGLIEQMSPSILIALINSMSPQEVVNNVASLQEKGAYDNPDIKKLVQDKLNKAKKSKNVAALKSKTAKDTGRIKDADISKQLDEVADIQIKKSGIIKVPTAIFVDRSGSMHTAIEVGKRCAAMVSGASEADLYVVAFDNMATEIHAEGKTLTAWEKAFKPISPGGSTSMGCALDYLNRKNVYVEQIVVITDEGENAAPSFVDKYREYQKRAKINPNVVVVHIDEGHWGHESTFTNNLKRAGIEFDVYKPDAKDYYSLPGLIPLLSRKSKLDLLYEIMDTPLPVRKPF